ncbi:MAG: ABC transporter ATP-binding protein [Candidatus Aminicenantes bacterium]|nr:ABC transporter ATP-binding protein [Candidatus Aminicenantes bacterium]
MWSRRIMGPESTTAAAIPPWIVRTEKIQRVFRSHDVATVALADATLAVKPGEMIAIMGPSGSGKSTLMAILGCLDRPTSGSYWLAGREVTELSDDELSSVRNRMVGFVFQSFILLQRSSALENVELPQVYAGISPKARRERAKTLLGSVGLGHRLGHRPNELSGGELQRVAIARALANDPKLLLADEPTGNLDRKSGIEIMDIFRRLNLERGMTEVVVTHNAEVAARCDRVIVIQDGRTRSEAEAVDA